MSAGITFREDRYGVNLLKALNQLRKEQKWSDFVIETKCGLVPVHRVVLAAAQNLHIQSLCFPLGEVSSFNLDNYSKNTVEIFVSYLYTGEISIDNEVQIKELLELCKSLKFTSLLNRKEFQQYIDKIDKNNDEVSNTHDDSKSSDNESPHTVFLTENQNGTVIVKQISEPSLTNENSDMYLTSDKPITDHSHVSNTELDDSVIHQICIKQEKLESDNESDKGQPLDDDMSESDKSISTPTISINEQKRTRSQHVTVTKRAKLDDMVENYAKKLVSSALGSSEDGSEEDESQPVETESEMKEEVSSGNDKNFETRSQSEEGKSNQKLHQCKECGHSFSRKFNLKRHEEIHQGKKYSCECGKTFTSLAILTVHRKRHTDPYPFVCTYEGCGKIYSTIYSLHQHKWRDHGDSVPNIKEYKCEVCDKKFAQKGHLREHMLCHSADKTLKCQDCCKTFKYTRSLKRHKTTCRVMKEDNTSLPVFQCVHCGMVFNKRQYFREHVQFAHTEPSLQCSTCGEMFKWRSSLARHINSKRCAKNKNVD